MKDYLSYLGLSTLCLLCSSVVSASAVTDCVRTELCPIAAILEPFWPAMLLCSVLLVSRRVRSRGSLPRVILAVCIASITQECRAEGKQASKATFFQQSEEAYCAAQKQKTPAHVRVVLLTAVPPVPASRPMSATTFYVSSSTGNDTNTGDSAETPWRTLDRVNATEAYPGDAFLFKRGDTWCGSIVKTNLTNVVFGAYGAQDKRPFFTGGVPLYDWVPTNLYNQHGEPVSNVYCTSLPAAYSGQTVPQLMLDDTRLTQGRFPDNDWRPATGIHVTETSTETSMVGIADSTLDTPSNYWAGATVFIRRHGYQVEAFTVTDSPNASPHDIMFSTPSKDTSAGPVYFIVDHVGAVNHHGEWYQTQDRSSILLYWTNGVPEDGIIDASLIPYGIYLRNSMTVTVQNLHFANYAQHGVYTEQLGCRSAYIDIVSNRIDNSRENGIFSLDTWSSQYRDNHIRNSGLHGLYGAGSVYCIISNNVIEDSGNQFVNSPLAAGCAVRVGYWVWTGLWAVSNRAVHNVVLNSGYDGIMLYGFHSFVEGNFISNVCTLLDDGGGVYTVGSQENFTKVIQNVVVDAKGTVDAGSYDPPLVMGIYIDSDKTNMWGLRGLEVEIGSNVVINSARQGIVIKDCRNASIHDNMVLHNNGIYADCTVGFGVEDPELSSNTLFKNVLLASSDQRKALAIAGVPSMERLACDSNLYCNIHTDDPHYVAADNTEYSFTQWTNSSYLQDAHSTDNGALLRDIWNTHGLTNRTTRVWYNPLREGITVDLGMRRYYDMTGGIVKGFITISPLRAKVLFSPFNSTEDTAVWIQTGLLPPGERNQIYSFQLLASGGTPAYRWTAISALPPVLSLSDDGVLSGTPETDGSHTLRLRVDDALGDSDTVTLDLRVALPESVKGVIGTGVVGAGNL